MKRNFPMKMRNNILSKIKRLDYGHEESIMGKRIEIKASDYPETVNIPIEEEMVSVIKRNGEPRVIDKINEIIDYINLPWYKKLFYK